MVIGMRVTMSGNITASLCGGCCSGGWYLELPDRRHSGHPAWVAPEALVLRAALDTLLREGGGGGGRRGEADSRGAGPAATLWTRLRARLSS